MPLVGTVVGTVVMTVVMTGVVTVDGMGMGMGRGVVVVECVEEPSQQVRRGGQTGAGQPVGGLAEPVDGRTREMAQPVVRGVGESGQRRVDGRRERIGRGAVGERQGRRDRRRGEVGDEHATRAEQGERREEDLAARVAHGPAQMGDLAFDEG